MLTLQIHNDGTGNNELGNYDCYVAINRHCLGKGKVEGFAKSQGYVKLLRLAITAIAEDKAMADALAEYYLVALEEEL